MTQPEKNINLFESSELKPVSTPAKILIVDDDTLILNVLEMTLKREGYDVYCADCGIEAIKFLHSEPIAIIICDQRMPSMNGLELLKHAQNIRPDSIRIALTGDSDKETIINAINIGQVFQFISKPWEDCILKQTVAAAHEKFRLTKENQFLHQLLIKQNKELERSNQTLRYEMLLGARIHEELLLGKVPSDIPGFSVAATTMPSKEIDGDFFDFYRPKEEVIDIAFGDVMGKGIPAALVGTAIKTQLLRFAIPLNHVKICNRNNFWWEDLLLPMEILSMAHREIATQLIELEFFVCLFYGRFDLAKKIFTFVDCGSTKPIHYKAKSGEMQFLSGHDFPIGMVAANSYHEHKVSFEDNDLFIFYSDGLTESRSPDNELFGTLRLMEVISTHAEKNANIILQKIRNRVLEHAQKDNFDDDLTLIVVKVDSSHNYLPTEALSATYLSDLNQLKSVRSFIKRICDNAPGDTLALYHVMELGIDEAFCNIVKHAYKNNHSQVICIKAQYQKDGLWIELSDQGDNFNPKKIAEPSLIGNDESGYGLFLIRQLVDQIVYHPKHTNESWNRFRIFKKYFFKEVPMDFSHTIQDSILVVVPTGPSLDAREAREFKDRIIELINTSNNHSIVIDMHNLQFIDSSGLGTFLSILKTLHAQKGELKLSNLNKPIRTIFELVSMHKIFEIYNTTEEAIQSFK